MKTDATWTTMATEAMAKAQPSVGVAEASARPHGQDGRDGHGGGEETVPTPW